MPPQITSEPGPQGGKENEAFPVPGKHSLVLNLQRTVARRAVLRSSLQVNGYSGPLKEIPHEKFNVTIIPKSYCSPWSEALGHGDELITALHARLPEPPHSLQPGNYRSFNRSAMPFGGMMSSQRVIPVTGFEAPEPREMPGVTMRLRPNFNRAPRGWGADYTAESSEL